MTTPTLNAALRYAARGWSLIPIQAGTKKPTCKWAKYQTERATEGQLTKWFGNGQAVGLAVVFGPVSGGLVCRDFDTMAGYEQWAAAYPDLAVALPTVATARGRHVYFCSAHRGIVKTDDGELHGQGYCLLPPSRHPNGLEYRWLVPLSDGPLPVVEDVQAAGFLDAGTVTERTEDNGENRGNEFSLSSMSSLLSPSSQLHAAGTTPEEEAIERVICGSLPTCVGKRNRQVFDLARA